MVQHKEIMIQRCIEKSNEALDVAQESLNNNRLTTALNRTYYAIFYTISALAYQHDFVTSKHTKLMGWFNKKFIHEDKIFDKKLITIYSDAFELRQENDYKHTDTPNPEEVAKLLIQAKDFIETVRTVTNHNIS